MVERPRITDLVRSHLEASRVLTVCAAAGAGKTTAIANALAHLDRPIAWLSLDGAESAAGRLLLYLEAAVAPHVPEATGAATDALAAGLPVSEAAGLLAESLYGSGVIVVCDNVERVADSSPAMATLSALARYVPSGVGLVLISRVALPLDTRTIGDPDRIADLTDRDLAFRVREAEAALIKANRRNIDPAEAVRQSGGWVTGVLFSGAGPTPQSTDRLHRFITAQVLGSLSDAERDFLIRTSLLAEVTVEDALALGEEEPGRVLAALRERHLPVVWPDDHTLSVGPQLRDYLLSQLAFRDPSEVDSLRRNHAALLAKKGEHEDAVTALIDLGDHTHARELARELLPGLVERMDLGLAARWLDAFPDLAFAASRQIAGIILRVAFGLEQPLRGVAVWERNGWDWVESLAAGQEDGSDETLVLLAWCLWHVNAVDDARRVCDLIRPGRAHDIAVTLLGLSSDDAPPAFPEFATAPAGPLEGLLMRVAHIRGRLQGLDAPGAHGPWRSVVGAPWVIAGLRATGRIEQAMELYELHRSKPQPLWLHGVDAAELMADLGRNADAWDAVQTGWERQSETGSQVYAILLHLVEARLHLKLNQDPPAAFRAIDAADERGAQKHSFTREFSMLWRGLAYLQSGEHERARELLQAAVDGMQRTEHRLELVSAAAYLSEAQWRAGDEEAADAAANLALEAAEDMGALHLLLAALADVPAVAVRGADTEPNRTSRWHELTTLLARRDGLKVIARHPRLVLEEFGPPVLVLDGNDVTPRLRKSTELLARVIAAPSRKVGRQEVLDGLFHSRSEPAARSYLRQAMYRLRDLLPEELIPVMESDQLSLAGPDLIVSTGEEVLAMIGQADRQDDEARAATLTQALARSDRGAYLQGFSSAWVDARRAEISERLLRARLDLARIAFRLGRYWESGNAVDFVLRQDPYREDAWLLKLSLAQASGSDDGVLATYQRYVATIKEIGVPPSAEIQRHVSRIRT
ncbi:BTAD domain-containing putative transcriptional regulator [Pimelobacter simplex]|uniref:BTAD domain-containing putative transcriptional regulator n=1 Tax=Nocardioides simplex TaxID=2045 RepID=UPI0027DB9C05